MYMYFLSWAKKEGKEEKKGRGEKNTQTVLHFIMHFAVNSYSI